MWMAILLSLGDGQPSFTVCPGVSEEGSLTLFPGRCRQRQRGSEAILAPGAASKVGSPTPCFPSHFLLQ
jgi:hypothetical protein